MIEITEQKGVRGQGALSRDSPSSDRTALRRNLEGQLRVLQMHSWSHATPGIKSRRTNTNEKSSTHLRIVRVGRSVSAACNASWQLPKLHHLSLADALEAKGTDGMFIPLAECIRDIVSAPHENFGHDILRKYHKSFNNVNTK
ncbi:hypothetical protein X777_02582 [Ooceraea biroi]|uniref:Uncharacterized protein n=1 Tax=Ooceraea biroi TaxID=2015173 RepID=A0A026WNS4_OOCBI|nr:hypothetical protein X777_02582 [Ooceraea biroi]